MDKDRLPRLRAAPLDEPLHIVLVDPEIPQNTGSVARLAAATGCLLHLVGRLGFRVDDKAVRRAGLDYWPLVQLHQHEDFAAFRRAVPQAGMHLFTAVAERSAFDVTFAPGDALVFGKESSGLPAELLLQWPDAHLALPTVGAVRSLNLASAASVVVYEALRGLGVFQSVRQG